SSTKCADRDSCSRQSNEAASSGLPSPRNAEPRAPKARKPADRAQGGRFCPPVPHFAANGIITHMKRTTFFVSILAIVCLGLAPQAYAASCESVTTLNLPNVRGAGAW